MKNYLKRHLIFKKVVLLSYILFLFFCDLQAQNEAYHGGTGDGSSFSQSTSINFEDINYEGTAVITATIDLATGQESITDNSPFNFSVTFNEEVTDFNSSDVQLSGTAIPTTAVVTGSGTTYNVQVSGTESNGTVIINIPSGSAHNSFGNPNQTASIINNEIIYSGQDLTVEITLSIYQSSITNKDTIIFVATFNDDVSGFTSYDNILLSGTANPDTYTISGSGAVYNIKVSGMTQDGTVIIEIPENAATNTYGKKSTASINTANQVVCDYTAPTVTIDLADGQNNPTYSFPIKFKIVFSENINYFTTDNIAYGGSENLNLEISGTGRVWEARITGGVTNETVSITIPAGITYDDALNPNEQSVNINNSVTFIGTTAINDIKNSFLNKVYYTNDNLIIDLKEFPGKNCSLQIYDIYGRLLLQKKLINKNSSFPISVTENIIIIRININDKSALKKLFLIQN